MCACFIVRSALARSVFALGLAAALLGAAGASGAPKAAAKPKKQEPIRITSNRMEAYSKKNFVDFIGDVVAIQGEMQIKSDKLRVYFQKKKAGAKKGAGKKAKPGQKAAAESSAASPENSVERIVATGNVLVNQGKGKFAAGERLDYNERTGIAVLTGNPRAWEGNNQIVGDKITLFLREERTIVQGSRSKRVNVTLFPSGENAPAPAGK